MRKLYTFSAIAFFLYSSVPAKIRKRRKSPVLANSIMSPANRLWGRPLRLQFSKGNPSQSPVTCILRYSF